MSKASFILTSDKPHQTCMSTTHFSSLPLSAQYLEKVLLQEEICVQIQSKTIAQNYNIIEDGVHGEQSGRCLHKLSSMFNL